MPRTARLVIDGGTYHVLTRGNNGQTIFHQDADYKRYLQLLSTVAQHHGLQVHHFVLMPNHVHLLLKVPLAAALSKAMLSLNLGYTLFYQQRYQYRGHLWQGRFKSFLVDRPHCLLKWGQAIELNPVRANLVPDPGAYPWSSYRYYAQGIKNSLIAPNPLYEALGTTSTERCERYRQFILNGLQRDPIIVAGRARGRPRKLRLTV